MLLFSNRNYFELLEEKRLSYKNAMDMLTTEKLKRLFKAYSNKSNKWV